jgi:diguanylate cyclase (GGDEF)-like protein
MAHDEGVSAAIEGDGVRRHALFGEPAAHQVVVLGVLGLAVACLVAVLTTRPLPGRPQLLAWAVFTALGLVTSYIGRRVQAAFDSDIWRDLSIAWSVPAAIFGGPVLAIATTVVQHGVVAYWRRPLRLVPVSFTTASYSLVLVALSVAVPPLLASGEPAAPLLLVPAAALADALAVTLIWSAIRSQGASVPLSSMVLGEDGAMIALGACMATSLVWTWHTNPWALVALAPCLLALELVSAHGVMRDTAMRDSRTNTLTMQAWRVAVTKRLRTDDVGGVLMIDLDHFKAVNDTYGHQAGDQVLLGCARSISEQLGGDVVVGRYGGEEFIAYVGVRGAREVWECAERVRAGLAALEHELAPGRAPLVVTGSVGAAVISASGERPLQSLIATADSALYRAKVNGRNRVEVDGWPAPPSAPAGGAGRT